MQAQQQAQRQADINERVAVALEKLNGRMENIEQWREERDRERERSADRRNSREDQRPMLMRNDVTILISLGMGAIYFASLIVSVLTAHWK